MNDLILHKNSVDVDSLAPKLLIAPLKHISVIEVVGVGEPELQRPSLHGEDGVEHCLLLG